MGAPRGVTSTSSTRKRRLWSGVGPGSGRASFSLRGLTFGENACHPEPIRGVYPERSEWAQGKLREGSGSPDKEILRCAQDDSQDTSQVRSREAFSPNVWFQQESGVN